MGKGGIIGKANEPTSSIASGVWSLLQQFNAVKNGIWPGGEIPLYAFTSFTFTSAGGTTRIGPNITQVRSAYSSTTWAQDNNYLSMDWNPGYQIWTVPKTGQYKIQAVGAGQSTGTYGYGGVIEALFQLTRGEKLAIVVGQQSSSTNDGCGGTFVARYNTVSANSSTPLIIAGGAGSYYGGDKASTSAYMAGTGKWGMSHGLTNIPWDDGYGGWGYHGGAGGGFYGPGQSNGSAPDRCGDGFFAGAAATTSGPLLGGTGQGDGGFGGGGGYHSGANGGGAGGGYSGGLGGYSSTGGDGGSCFVANTGTQIKSSGNSYPSSTGTLGQHRGSGNVSITFIS